MRLYHRTSEPRALAIMLDGFGPGDGVAGAVELYDFPFWYLEPGDPGVFVWVELALDYGELTAHGRLAPPYRVPRRLIASRERRRGLLRLAPEELGRLAAWRTWLLDQSVRCFNPRLAEYRPPAALLRSLYHHPPRYAVAEALELRFFLEPMQVAQLPAIAEAALAEGHDGWALRELCWRRASWVEADALYRQALGELGLAPLPNPEALERAARYVAEQMATGAVSAYEGALTLLRTLGVRPAGLAALVALHEAGRPVGADVVAIAHHLLAAPDALAPALGGREATGLAPCLGDA